MNNPLDLVVVSLALVSLSCACLWKIPPSLGREKRPSVGFYHRQAAKLWRSVVLAAAWWYDLSLWLVVTVAHYPASICGRWVSLEWGFRVDSAAQWLGRWLFLNNLAWLIARDHLQAKWQAELDEQNYLFLRDRSDKWGQS